MAACTANGAWDATADLFPDAFGAEAPQDWQQRRIVSVRATGTTGTVSDFPVMVRVPAAAGDPIGFYATRYRPGMQALPHTISATLGDGSRIAWVRLPAIDAADPPVFYLYSGGRGNGIAPAPELVWNNGYRVVMHLEERGSTAYRDSSGRGNHSVSTPFGARPGSVSASLGYGAHFNQNTDGDHDKVIGIPNSPDVDTMGALNVTILLRPEVNVGASRLVSKGDWYWALDTTGTRLRSEMQYRLPTESRSLTGSLLREWNSVPTENQWNVLTLNHSGRNEASELRLFIDAAEASVLSGTNDPEDGPRDEDSAKWLAIGNGDWANATRGLQGVVDEVRIAEAERSDTWIRLEYLSLTDQLITVGPAESP